jgi:CDGSH-type Zn-finger protein/uncharacterized Fe-S cluster protein YjdI
MSDGRQRGDVHGYSSDAIEVTWDKKRCIHSADCVRGLPAVFVPGERPWVRPAEATADAVAEVVERCPTGALRYRRTDGGAAEKPTAENVVRLGADGPVYVRGRLEIHAPDGSVREETRAALCRCGASANKPFCDNSHVGTGFAAAAELPEGAIEELAETAPLILTVRPNGSIGLEGPYRALDPDGTVRVARSKGSLCRCGASQNKPWCDGSHKTVGFEG